MGIGIHSEWIKSHKSPTTTITTTETITTNLFGDSQATPESHETVILLHTYLLTYIHTYSASLSCPLTINADVHSLPSIPPAGLRLGSCTRLPTASQTTIFCRDL